MLWDRSDPNGYAQPPDRHTRTAAAETRRRTRSCSTRRFGDFQVSNYATEVEIRTLGGNIHQPALAPGRHYVRKSVLRNPGDPELPFDGTALVVWDSGTAPPPTTNQAPSVRQRSAQ